MRQTVEIQKKGGGDKRKLKRGVVITDIFNKNNNRIVLSGRYKC
ncbi:MAG: hypothetical protein SWO11_01265 [Thermodesulfobacteriota bacterium]|nr:hypothetical protein [Thermodesulfobacteriota bacterium]